ncbi:HD-GYP domain-containing protein [Desulfuribacillus alkaliarsenatis]|uniref:HD-GYP domain-containing protein n=1 Tax=Desulfuribacillus alkaliarsenatis TaxID=766136 RepID=A0A1E5G047_9FIRM|nr:HD domain-containing phosphohydrolase [Desulfuribacillus alkaliarsenatis]OEF96192.1 hypothetical protein BHF68_08470 [Desulfuribacillus alkaliarsenatis]
MIYTAIDNVKYGQILARNIYSSDGNILLRQGVELSVGLITRLRNMGVNAIYIQDDRFIDVEVEDVVSEETKREAMSNLAFAVQSIQAGKDFNIAPLKKTIDNVVTEIIANKNVLANLSDIRTKDNSLFVHSINTCMISVLMGIQLNINKLQLAELAIGSLLHDIGKVLAKDDDKEHPWHGFNVLRKKHDFNVMTAHIALQHHEYLDGSGYPRGVTGEEIPLFAKICGVADHFDSLLEKKSMKPYEACENIMALANTKFDLNIVNVFLKSIAVYPNGSWVTLTSGEIGVVVRQHKGLPTRPVIRIFKSNSDDTDWQNADMLDIDLAKEKTLFIKSTLSE